MGPLVHTWEGCTFGMNSLTISNISHHMWSIFKNEIHVIKKLVKTSLLICLCILRDFPQQKIPRELWGGGDLAIFLRSHENIFLWDRSGKLKKTRRKEWRNKKEEILLGTSRFPHSCVLHQLGMPSGYCPHTILPQENPLIWKSPLQQRNYCAS